MFVRFSFEGTLVLCPYNTTSVLICQVAIGHFFAQSTFSTKVSTFFLQFFLLTGNCFSVRMTSTSNSNAVTGNSTPRRGIRERTAGESPPKAQAKAPLERGQEMARRSPAVTGFESKTQCALNSGGNTDSLFALSQSAQVFLFSGQNSISDGTV